MHRLHDASGPSAGDRPSNASTGHLGLPGHGGSVVRTFREAKEMAKALRADLRGRRQVELTHSECLEIVARQFGLDNRNVLAARIEKEGRSRIVPRFLLIPVLRITDENRQRIHLGDVDALREELTARRGDVPEVEEMSWGYRILYLTDPFGNLLQFSEPLDSEQRSAMPRWTS